MIVKLQMLMQLDYALKIHKNVHLILGGQAKENNFDQLKFNIENVSRIYLIGEAALSYSKKLCRS